MTSFVHQIQRTAVVGNNVPYRNMQISFHVMKLPFITHIRSVRIYLYMLTMCVSQCILVLKLKIKTRKDNILLFCFYFVSIRAFTITKGVNLLLERHLHSCCISLRRSYHKLRYVCDLRVRCNYDVNRFSSIYKTQIQY